jgi:hypothetical protein
MSEVGGELGPMGGRGRAGLGTTTCIFVVID